MKHGNWVPMSKAFVRHLPGNREFTSFEAMFSLSVDYDNGNSVSVSGYSSLWGWSRKKVSNFLKKHNLEILYADKYNRHKRGVLVVKLGVPNGEQEGNRIGTGREQVEFIDSKDLRKDGNRVGAGGEQVGNRKGSTTNEPNPKPNPLKDNTDKKNPSKKFDPMSIRPEWFSEKDWQDVVTHRAKHPKKPAQTQRAFEGLISQFSAAVENGFTITECVDEMTNRSWAGFKAEWMKREGTALAVVGGQQMSAKDQRRIERLKRL